jgi:nucleoside-diphosphate-sugar epimerase
MGALAKTPGNAALLSEISGKPIPAAHSLAGRCRYLDSFHSHASVADVQEVSGIDLQQSVLLTGASSQLGVFLLPRLLDAGFQVMALSREGPAAPICIAPGLYWTHPDLVADFGADFGAGHGVGSQGQLAYGVNQLISCGPLELAIQLIGRCPRLQQAVVFSTSSVLSKQHSVNDRERAHIAAIRQAESSLRELCDERKLPLLLLRPTLIYGCGQDRNISLLARIGSRFGFIPVAGKASGLRQPVHADDLAQLAVNALLNDEEIYLESEVSGGSSLSYREMAEVIAASCKRRVRVIRVPERLLAVAIATLSLLPRWRSLNAEMVHRQNRDLVFDDSALRKALNYDPRAFKPTLADFEVPEYARKFQLP